MEHLFNSSTAPTDPQKENEEGGVWEEEVGTDTWAQLRAQTQPDTTTTTTVCVAADVAYKRTSTVEVGDVGKKKKTGTVIGRKSTTTETKVEAKGKPETKMEGKRDAKSAETKVETTMTETTNTMATTSAGADSQTPS